MQIIKKREIFPHFLSRNRIIINSFQLKIQVQRRPKFKILKIICKNILIWRILYRYLILFLLPKIKIKKKQDWAISTSQQKRQNNKKLIIVFPGLVSSTNEPYIQNIMSKMYMEGYKVCLINDRIYTNRDPCKTIELPENEYFSFVKDCREVINIIKQEYQDYQFYAIGHSFGANTLAKYLGDFSNENPFLAAVCVSNPWDFYIGIRHLSQIADNYLVSSRKKVLMLHKERFFDKNQKLFDYQKIDCSKNCIEFDNQFIVKAQGYKTADQYYRNISSIHAIDKIKIPVLFLQSKDDPILNYRTIPYDEVMHTHNLIMVVTNTGGHVGWFEGLFQPKRWYIKPTLEFLQAVDFLNENSNVKK
ncbi:hypothetical protein IMG5_130510 [Ichthyophthirius multifiliis]|uniref:Serine aminopeptidase S33 domain-containing protein n=1 Tax=Ichthyophthirius multifiliis TaxID=5932 RepID=G0QWA5_ICHMU|nr:hypothetical protein IMG5_130510 [Ichthyophthirius multifiliis]EGR30500.1 hypothetical protein IMG5_130510 [Ichthyophthirius multifiliis]|eukprot:XP_004032087.1 hypothetical protein IMG5_130510 [Ichthyophthirius multifiliis]